MEVSGQFHVPAALPPGKEPPLDGPQSRSGRRDVERNFTNLDDRERGEGGLIQYDDKTTGWMTGVRFPAGVGKGFFYPRFRVQIGSRAHPTSYPMGTGDSFPGE
jgi:hypothetical protein